MQCFDPLRTASVIEPFDFHEFAPFNDGAFAVFRGNGVAASDWEIHHDTDEMLFVVSGSVTVEIRGDDDSTSIPLTAGQFDVAPEGLWHRHVDVVDLVEMYYTPGTSIQSTAEDPRTQ